MKNFLKKYLWAFYLGTILAIFDITFLNWQFWAIIVPTNILVVWGNYKD